MLGIHGNNLLDSVFMKPSPQTTLMEFFPPDMFSRDRELAAHALGMHYVAWWNHQYAVASNLSVYTIFSLTMLLDYCTENSHPMTFHPSTDRTKIPSLSMRTLWLRPYMRFYLVNDLLECYAMNLTWNIGLLYKML
jgi:hypothetical protein